MDVSKHVVAVGETHVIDEHLSFAYQDRHTKDVEHTGRGLEGNGKADGVVLDFNDASLRGQIRVDNFTNHVVIDTTQDGSKRSYEFAYEPNDPANAFAGFQWRQVASSGEEALAGKQPEDVSLEMGAYKIALVGSKPDDASDTASHTPGDFSIQLTDGQQRVTQIDAAGQSETPMHDLEGQPINLSGHVNVRVGSEGQPLQQEFLPVSAEMKKDIQLLHGKTTEEIFAALDNNGAQDNDRLKHLYNYLHKTNGKDFPFQDILSGQTSDLEARDIGRAAMLAAHGDTPLTQTALDIDREADSIWEDEEGMLKKIGALKEETSTNLKPTDRSDLPTLIYQIEASANGYEDYPRLADPATAKQVFFNLMDDSLDDEQMSALRGLLP